MGLSEEARREQKTSEEGCLRQVGLEAREEAGAQSAPLANTQGKAESREETADLMERILDRDNLNRAVKRVIRNKGSHGIDGMQVDELLPYLKEHGLSIVSELRAGSYRPQPVRKVAIPKPDGGKRELGIPTVIDRFVQQAVAQVLTEVFEPEFSDSSYGFRPGRSAHMALETALGHVNDGYRYVVDIDLEKFFDRVNHDILMGLVEKKIGDNLLFPRNHHRHPDPGLHQPPAGRRNRSILLRRRKRGRSPLRHHTLPGRRRLSPLLVPPSRQQPGQGSNPSGRCLPTRRDIHRLSNRGFRCLRELHPCNCPPFRNKGHPTALE